MKLEARNASLVACFAGALLLAVPESLAQECNQACPTAQGTCGANPQVTAYLTLPPEPEKRIREKFTAGLVVGRTTTFLGSREMAEDLAMSNAKVAAGNACSRAGGSLEYAMPGYGSCRQGGSGGKEFVCEQEATPHCTRLVANPAHAQWKLDKAQREHDEREDRKREREWKHCMSRAETEFNRCESRRKAACDRAGSGSGTGAGSGTGSGTGTSTGTGSGTGTGTGTASGPGTGTSGFSGANGPPTASDMVEQMRQQRDQQLRETGLSMMARQQAQAAQDADRALGEMSAMLANDKISGTSKLYGIGLVGVSMGLYHVGGSLLNSDGFADYFLPATLFGGVAAALALGGMSGANRSVLKARQRRGATWLGQLRGECDAGQLSSCYEVSQFSQKLSDLALPADEKHDASVIRGLGPMLGPSFSLQTMLGFASDEVDSATHSGSLFGMYEGLHLRSQFLRASLVHSHRYGEVTGSSDSIGLFSYEASIGAQLGQGMLSPFVDFGGRLSYQKGDNVPDLPDGAGSGAVLTLGNTFNFAGLFASGGPVFSSLAADIAYTVSLDDFFASGWRFGLGWSWADSIPFEEPLRDVKKRPKSYVDKLGFYISPDMLAIELMRWNGRSMGRHKNPDEVDTGIVIGALEVNIGLGGAGKVGGLSLLPLGLRGHMFDRRIEYGFRSGLMGFRVYDGTGGGLLGGDDSGASIGFLPTKTYVRTFVNRKIPVEVGLDVSPVWFRIDRAPDRSDPSAEQETDVSFFGGGVPMRLYVGTAL